MKKLICFSVLVSIQLLGFCQSSRLLDFNVQPVDNNQKALVSWTMKAGSTCTDVRVERSNDSIKFEEVYEYPSICGNEDSASNYSWIDPNPLIINTSYYRLKLDNVEFSLVSELYLNSKLGKNNIVLYPNPNGGDFIIEFINPNQEKFDLEIFKLDGSVIYSELNKSGKTYRNSIHELPKGIYMVRIKVGQRIIHSIKLFIR